MGRLAEAVFAMIANNPLLLAFVLVSFLGAPPVSRAQKVNCAKPKTLSIAGLGECANQELAAAEREMKQTFQEVLVQYTPTAKRSTGNHGSRNSPENLQAQFEQKTWDSLKASQDVWLKYRESACKAVRFSYGLGTSAEINVPECKADLTRARTKFLRTYFLKP